MAFHITEIDSVQSSSILFSICTLVTDQKEYGEMLDSFKAAGFLEDRCEFLYANNTNQNNYDAYAGIKKFLSIAKGRYVILCHQDICLNKDNYQKLVKCIDEMDTNYPDWGILGNAGGLHIKKNIYRISYPDGTTFNDKPFPRKVKTLDENFLILKKEANIGISNNLKGYHLYGTDLCLIAGVLGYECYVIDFLITHKSYGNPDKSFQELKEQLIHKYQKALKGGYFRTTITIIYLSGSKIKTLLFNKKWTISLSKFFFKVRNRGNLS